MKRYQKAIQLGALLLGMIGCIMGLKTTVEASERELKTIEMNDFEYWGTKPVVIVEKGVEGFYIPEYCLAKWKDGKWEELSAGMPDMSYQSSNEAVASVEPSGRVVTKKTGTTTLTVTLCGKSDSVQLKVIDDMEVYADKIYKYEYSKKAYKQCEKIIKKFLSVYQEGEIISLENPKRAYQLANLDAQVAALIYSCGLRAGVFEDGAERERMFLAYPIIEHYDHVTKGLYKEVGDEILFEGEKNLIKSVSGKGRTITITLKKAVTEKMLFDSQCLWAGGYIDSGIKRTNCLKIPAYVEDNKTGHSYPAEAVIKKGSKKIIFRTRKLNMKKGRSYRVDIFYSGYSMGSGYWLKTKGKFKAK